MRNEFLPQRTQSKSQKNIAVKDKDERSISVKKNSVLSVFSVAKPTTCCHISTLRNWLNSGNYFILSSFG